MNQSREFRPLQAEEIAKAFNEQGVDYLFILASEIAKSPKERR